MTANQASWLLEQIAEDERLAHDEVERRKRWQVELEAKHQRGEVPALIVLEYDGPGSPADPARVLAECDAKRKMVEWAADRLADAARLESKGANKIDLMALRMGPECILDALLPIYADRPDYRQEWAP